MAKVELKSKVIIYIIVVLVGMTAILALLNRPSEDLHAAALTVSQDGADLHTFTLEEIKALPSVSVEKSIVSSNHADESGVFTGVPLHDLIKGVDANLLTGERRFITRAEDGYASVFTTREVLEPDNIIIVYDKDGQSLGSYEEGGTGPLRIVIQGDPFGNRSTKYLKQIEIK
ncbi:MAG: molybdopterin-dependent oxidoreductase [Pelotomaculum sp.]|jgi:hypothetical protein|nr:molybdopterin-dependent oxidoreductase [Bacillota bacterium]